MISILILVIPQTLSTSFVLKPNQLLSYCNFVRAHLFKNFLTNYEEGIDKTRIGLPQNYIDMLGWNAMVDQVHRITKNSNKDSLVIFCQNYGEAGAVEIIGKKYKLNHVISLHDNFYYWSASKNLGNVKELLLVTRSPYSKSVTNCFKKVELVGQFRDLYAKEDMTVFYLFSQPTTPFNGYWQYLLQNIDNPSAAYTL